jgi:hypothetical protein
MKLNFNRQKNLVQSIFDWKRQEKLLVELELWHWMLSFKFVLGKYNNIKIIEIYLNLKINIK